MSPTLRLSDEHIRLVHRAVADSGAWPGQDHFSEDQYDEHLQDFLLGRPDAPLGVFAYGSLIWKPAFPPASTYRATAMGWERAFTLRQKRFRGTPDYPGLMMQIDRGGSCEGVVQLISSEAEWAVLSDLWRREMTVRPPSNYPRWIDVSADGAVRKVIAFTANPDSPNYAGRLELEEVAVCLSQACGHWGSGADYLLQTTRALESVGIHDAYLWTLQDRVASLIEERFSLVPSDMK